MSTNSRIYKIFRSVKPYFRLSRLSALFVLGLLLFLCPPLEAQETEPAPPSPVSTEKKAMSDDSVKQASLIGILDAIKKLEAQLRARQEELRSPEGQGRQEEIVTQIQALSERLDQLRRNFSEIASGVDTEGFTQKDELANVDWSRDLREILSPLIHEVRRLTSRPREIDRLNTLIEEFESIDATLDQAKGSLLHQIQNDTDENLKKELRRLVEDFDVRKQNIQTQLGITRQKLNKRLGEQVSIGESVQNIFQLFFRSRGLNFILALLASSAFWVIARRFSHGAQRVLHNGEPAEKGFYHRFAAVLLMLLTLLGTVAVFLITLYFLGDWVLLILALMLILGLVWTSKHALQQFWNHAATLLNMGACREGERVLYNNLPWELRSVSLFCNLVNPVLVGGSILLPIRDLSSLRSRPYDPEERWFPTNVGDWLLLENDDLVRVEFQSTEVVRLRYNGGSEAVIPASKFYEQSGKNISNGFRHRFIFGLDYKHQPEVLTKIPEVLKEEIRLALESDGYLRSLKNLEVDFEEAASSSLNLMIEADFYGAAAGAYNDIRRTLNAACVQACNKFDWVIPFNQLVLHMPTKEQSPRAAG